MLHRLVEEVKAEQGGAVLQGTAPPNASYREAVRYMAHRLYLRSPRYREALGRVDLSRLDPDAHEFVRGFQRMMANVGIPVLPDPLLSDRDRQRWYVLGLSESTGSVFPVRRSVALMHAIYADRLTPVCWSVFEHVGTEVARKQGLGVQWGGPTAPWQWIIDP